MNIPDYLLPVASKITKWAFVGSRVVCDPPPNDTDIDVLVLVGGGLAYNKVLFTLNDKGWSPDGSGPDEEFISMRNLVGKQLVNLIIMRNQIHFDRFILAANLSKALNVMDKDLRVVLHEAIRHQTGPNLGLIEVVTL